MEMDRSHQVAVSIISTATASATAAPNSTNATASGYNSQNHRRSESSDRIYNLSESKLREIIERSSRKHPRSQSPYNGSRSRSPKQDRGRERGNGGRSF